MFKDQVVIIIDAGRGIGAEAAELFAKNSAAVVINDLNETPTNTNETVAAKEEADGKGHYFAGNVDGFTFDVITV